MNSFDSESADSGNEPSEEFDFGMTDLEERLKGPDGHALREQILERLTALGNETKAGLDGGLAPDEYAIAESTYGALAAAYDIIANFPTTPPEENK